MNSPILKLSLIALVLICLIGCKEKNNQVTDSKNSIFDIPFENIKIEKTIYEINPTEDTVLNYISGSKIVIPKDAFLDKNGNIINNNIKIEYREFKNALDIYVSGIPMVYNNNGEEQVFETAGMLEINAYSNGEPVFANPQNKINIQMSSFQNDEKFNVYSLDTNTGVWTYLGKDKILEENLSDVLDTLPEVPQKPVKAGVFSFKIKDYTGKYPEIDMYENVLFEPVDNKKCGFSDATEITVKDIGKGVYELTFKFAAYGVFRMETCKCYLAFKEGVDYDNALKTYQKKYKNLIAKRDKMKKAIEDQWKNYYDVKNKYEQMGLLDVFYKKDIKNLDGENKITRSIELSGFGYINCDYPSSYPQGAKLIAEFTDKNGKKLNISKVVLLVKGTNLIYTYYKNEIKFNPNDENILWGITDDNKLAYLKSEDFKNITQTSGNFTFVMNVNTSKIETYEDVCKILF